MFAHLTEEKVSNESNEKKNKRKTIMCKHKTF